MLNIVTGKRYSIVPDEVVQYAAGFYGETGRADRPERAGQDHGGAARQAGDRQSARAAHHRGAARRYGTDDDDELILRALVPEPDLEKMRAAGPVKRDLSAALLVRSSTRCIA